MPTSNKPKTSGAAKRPAAKTKPTAKAPRKETKQDLVLRMLRRKSGATIPAVMEATGWLEHSVRGFLSAVVRKRLGLTLILEGEAGKRQYRIVDGKQSKGGNR